MSDVARRLGLSRQRVHQIFTKMTNGESGAQPFVMTTCPICYEVIRTRHLRARVHTATPRHQEAVRRARELKTFRMFRLIADRADRSTECWLWTGGKAGLGYGYIKVGTKTVYAHRLAWLYAYGPIPDGQWIGHTCYEPSCIRPSHLYSGSPGEIIARRRPRKR